jgi:hypothetical protein
MPCRLINARATFQQAMDIAFRGLLGKCVVVYLDDVTIFANNKEDHISHLNKLFNRCRKYDISLNPKKSIFVVDEGNILGFIISKHGMRIEPDRIEAIAKIPRPRNKKSMQLFLRKINLLDDSYPILLR